MIAATAIATTGAYVGFLAWDTKKTLGSDGSLHGPYEAWQVIGVVAILFALAVAGGMLGAARLVATTGALVMTIGTSISGETSRYNDGLWPIGTILIGCGTLFGALLVGATTSRVHAAHRKPHG
jgi:hypothetical protein